MTDLITRTQNYYRAWEQKDRAALLAAVTPDLEFRSPSHEFDSAAAFLDECLEPFGGVPMELVSTVAGNGEVFVAYELRGPDGTPMPIAEHLRFEGERIAAVRVYIGMSV